MTFLVGDNSILFCFFCWIFLRIKYPVFVHLQALLRRSRVFSRALGCGALGVPPGTLRRNFGPRPGSVGHALGVQSRASFLFFMGLRSAPPSHARSWKPRNGTFKKMFFRNAVSEFPYQLSKGSYSQAATVQQQPRFILCPL